MLTLVYVLMFVFILIQWKCGTRFSAWRLKLIVSNQLQRRPDPSWWNCRVQGWRTGDTDCSPSFEDSPEVRSHLSCNSLGNFMNVVMDIFPKLLQSLFSVLLISYLVNKLTSDTNLLLWLKYWDVVLTEKCSHIAKRERLWLREHSICNILLLLAAHLKKEYWDDFCRTI